MEKKKVEMVTGQFAKSDLCILFYRVGRIMFDSHPWCLCNDLDLNGENVMVEKRILDYIVNAVEERMKNDGLIG